MTIVADSSSIFMRRDTTNEQRGRFSFLKKEKKKTAAFFTPRILSEAGRGEPSLEKYRSPARY